MRLIAIPLEDERLLAFHARATGWRRAGMLDEGELAAVTKAPWRTSRLWTRAAFFVLAVLASVMLYGFLTLLSLPRGYATAALTIAFAELLIRKKKFIRTGIEEGFYTAGLCAFIFGLPGKGEPEAIFLFVAAFAFAGFRLANGLLVAVAALLIVLYAGVKGEDAATAGAAAALMFGVAAFLNARDIARPFLAFACALLSAVLWPLATLLWFAEFWSHRVPAGLLLIAAAAAAALTVIALLRRDRALLAAGVAAIAITAVHTAEHIALAWEWLLLTGGVTTLAVALVANRVLRGRASGITSDRLEELAHADVIELAGATTLGPAAAERQAPQGPSVQTSTSGGSFGGAGSSGEY